MPTDTPLRINRQTGRTRALPGSHPASDRPQGGGGNTRSADPATGRRPSGVSPVDLGHRQVVVLSGAVDPATVTALHRSLSHVTHAGQRGLGVDLGWGLISERGRPRPGPPEGVRRREPDLGRRLDPTACSPARVPAISRSADDATHSLPNQREVTA